MQSEQYKSTVLPKLTINGDGSAPWIYRRLNQFSNKHVDSARMQPQVLSFKLLQLRL